MVLAMLRLVERELAQIVDVEAQKLVCARLDVVVGVVHVVLLLLNPRALLGQPTKEKREEGGRIMRIEGFRIWSQKDE